MTKVVENKDNKYVIIKNIIYFCAITAFMFFVAYWSLDGSHLDFDTYYSLEGDPTAMEMHIRSIQENGLKGLYYNYRIGAPEEASALVDATGVDFMLGLMIWVLNILFRPTTARLFYYTLILTFIVIAWAMSYLLHKLKIDPVVNFVFSSLFSLAPYHFYRYMDHLALGNAFTVPLAVLLCLYVLEIVDDDRLADRIIYALCGLMLGLGCAYYTFFGFIIMLMAVIMKWANLKSIKDLLKRLWVIAVTVFGFGLSRTPALLLTMADGENTYAFVRRAFEQEIY